MVAGKKGINSKDKGSDYERKIAKALGGWWGEQFNRTPASGGLHWKEDNRVAGDIVTPPKSVYPWSTECKKRESWEFHQILKGTGEFESYWEQAIADAKRVNMRPLLIFSKNFNPDYIMLTWDDFVALHGDSAPFTYFAIHKAGKGGRVVCLLDEFIKNTTKQHVMEAFGLN